MTTSNLTLPRGATSVGPGWVPHAWALLGYFVLALLVTYPAAIHFTGAVPGDLIADRDQNLWNLWWVREAIGRLSNPFHTDMLYYPYGTDLYYHTLGLPQALLALLPQMAFGLPAAYNTVLLVSFTLSGYGAFRLALMYTEKALPAFLGGVVFAFTPYTLDALKGQLEVLSVQWLPFYAEAWLRSWQAEGKRRAALLFLAGLFLALAALSSLYYALYLLLFTAAHVAYMAFKTYRASRTNPGEAEQADSPWTVKPTNARNLVLTPVAVGAVSLLLLAPFAAGLLRDRNNPRLEVRADPAHRLAHSADLLSFFAPPHDHPLLPQASNRPGVDEPPLHDYLSLGYAALLLSVVGAWTARKSPGVKFWVGLALLALLLSMGPQLQVGRHLTGVPLPFRLLEPLPGLDAIAKPERLVVLARLCMGVLAAWGAARLLGRFRRDGSKLRAALPFTAVLALLLLELPIHPRYEEPLAVPSAFTTMASNTTEAGGMMEVPFATQQAQTGGERMLAQTVHGHPIMAGYLSRNYNSPIIDSCSPFWGFISPRDVPSPADEIASPLVTANPLLIFNFYNIKYLALYSRYAGPGSALLDPKDRQAYSVIAGQVSGAGPLFKDPDVEVYGVRDDKTPVPGALFHIGAGWYKPEKVLGLPFRWVNGGAGTLCVFSPRPITGTLMLEGTAYGQDQPVTLMQGDKTVVSGSLPQGGIMAPVKSSQITLQAGMIEIKIVAGKPGLTPLSVDPGTKDDRPLTVGIRNVRLEETPQK